MKAYVKENFSEWKQTDKATTIRSSGGDVGGGSEVLIISAAELSEHYRQETTKVSEINMSKRER